MKKKRLSNGPKMVGVIPALCLFSFAFQSDARPEAILEDGTRSNHNMENIAIISGAAGAALVYALQENF